MKALNNFLEKANLFKVFIAGWLFTGGFIFLLFYLFSTVESKIDGIKSLVLGSLCGIPFGLMFMLMISMMRKSQKFWDYAKEVEELIEKTESKSGLESIFDNEFQTLRNLSQGGPHTFELNKQYQTMKTKHKYVK